MSEIAKWLCQQNGVTDVTPATVTIGTQTWNGAFFTQRGRQGCYLVGALPKSFIKHKAYYRMPDDDRDWYVGLYYDGYDKNQYHPFGANCILMPWTSPTRIDEYERTRDRMQAKVEVEVPA